MSVEFSFRNTPRYEGATWMISKWKISYCLMQNIKNQILHSVLSCKDLKIYKKMKHCSTNRPEVWRCDVTGDYVFCNFPGFIESRLENRNYRRLCTHSEENFQQYSLTVNKVITELTIWIYFPCYINI